MVIIVPPSPAADSGGPQDTVTGQCYEGRPCNRVNFEGKIPKRPSGTMREVACAEFKKAKGVKR